MAITRLNNNSLTSITALPTAISTGKIGQVLQAYKSDNFETSASSDTDIQD